MDSGDIESNFDKALLELGPDEILRPINTLPLHELRLRQFCVDNGIVCYLPLRKVWKVVRQRHGGREYSYPREVIAPMFKSYLFAKLNSEQRSLIFRSKSVNRILNVGESFLESFYGEIRMIRRIELIGIKEPLDFNAEIKEGEKFLIETGPWQGTYGWLVKKEKRFLWTVEIECVGQFVRAEINPSKYKMSRAEE